MDFNAIVDRLSKVNNEAATSNLAEFLRITASQAAAQLCDNKCKIVDLVKGLNAVLTNGSYEIRARGVELMTQVVKALPASQLSEKEIEVMTEFICLRLIDHKSMEQPALECLAYFVECDNKPARYNKQLIEFIKNKANIHKMEVKIRKRIYEMLKKFVAERKRQSNTMDGDFIYSLVTILEGENNPDNLMLCFGMISFILSNFDDLDAYIEDIFEWLTSYYPIDYTPSDEKAASEGEINIQRLDLVEALYECFYANPLNSENLQTLLLEKLDSNVVSTKLESLECLIKCYEKHSFPLASIVKYNSTLWTALRMNCLRKIDTIEPRFLETSLRTLTTLAERLSKDSDMYFTFISDMYEELAIAFRKPEMELFEPAARLVTHAILPSMVGFNYVLDKLLPITLNALVASELRPLTGLAYIFEQLHQRHPDAQLVTDLNQNLTKLTLTVTNLSNTMGTKDKCRLLNALFSQRVPLSEDSLKLITGKLWAEFLRQSSNYLDIEKCLALLCVKYSQFNLITKCQVERSDLNTLIRLIYDYDLTQANTLENMAKFSIYLRILTIRLDRSTCAQLDALDQLILNDSLARLREQLELIRAEGIDFRPRICEQSAIIHAITLNKLAPNNANQILMKFFSSNYCQRLVAAAQQDASNKCLTLTTYLPHVKWIFKSLVIRNHQLATPLINLILNCVTSDKVHPDVAREASLVFSFVLAPPPSPPPSPLASNCVPTTTTTTTTMGDTGRCLDEQLFTIQNNYQIFSLYKQKLYVQASKEVRLRFVQQMAASTPAAGETSSSCKSTCSLLIFAIASQLAHLPLVVYKRDHDWLLRQILAVLAPAASNNLNVSNTISACKSSDYFENLSNDPTTSALFQAIYSCLERLIHRDLCDGLVPFLPSLIDLNLKNAHRAGSLLIRRQALLCLAKIAATFKESDLLMYRASVVAKLRVCLADKKRLVRQAAGETRLRWVTIAQPIGST